MKEERENLMKPKSFLLIASVFALVALLLIGGSAVMAQGPLPPQGSHSPTPENTPLPPQGSYPQGSGNTGNVEPVGAPHGTAPQSLEAVAANINARMADGVVSICQYNPTSSWGSTIAGIRAQLNKPRYCP